MATTTELNEYRLLCASIDLKRGELEDLLARRAKLKRKLRAAGAI